MDYINNLINLASHIISNGGFLFGMFIVVIEAFIPILPLSLFIALNTHVFGMIPGILLSWISTSFGSFLVYSLFYYLSNDVIYKRISKKTKAKIEKSVDKFQNISLANLTVIITLPFTPAFFVNILGGVAGINRKKFVIATLIGKIFMVAFWGIVGKSFIESMADVTSIIIIGIMIVTAYALSKLISKEFNIK